VWRPEPAKLATPVIIRVVKRNRFTTISNVPLNDNRLSWETRGLLAWLLSKPDAWIVNREAIIRHGRAGRDKVTRMLSELAANGYFIRTRRRDREGQFRWDSVIYEEPIRQHDVGQALGSASGDSSENPLVGNPEPDRPASVEPSTAKPPLTNTDSIKTELREGAGARSREWKPWPEDFRVDGELREFAKLCGCDADDELPAFRDYCRGQGEKYASYRSAFKGWMRKTKRYGVAVHVRRTDELVAEPSREKCRLKRSSCRHVCHHGGCSDLPPDECGHIGRKG